MASFSVTLDEF